MKTGTLFLILIVCIAGLLALFLLMPEGVIEKEDEDTPPLFTGDFDPLVDIEVIFRLDAIRKMDVLYGQPPTFAVEVAINEETYHMGEYMGYSSQPAWRLKADVDDYTETVNMEVRVREITALGERMCDISPRGEEKTLQLTYSLKTGDWQGDDFRGDENGYGHAAGSEDGTTGENDYEIWFDVYQTDFDGDRVTYWEEVYLYQSDPMVDNRDDDQDGDGVPLGWEDTYGYNPWVWENHSDWDPDRDGLTNCEEWATAQWDSDPFAQDIFMEVDCMEGKSRLSQPTLLGEYTKQRVISSFARQNIVMHIDDGGMGGGGDIVGFEEFLTRDKLPALYTEYFLQDGEEGWRRGVFHYCILGHYTFPENKDVAGYATWSSREVDTVDMFVLGMQTIRDYRLREKARETATASLFMHELGHTLGLFAETFPGIDNASTKAPWGRGWWLYAEYQSCMNYRYAWQLVDYSDGTRGDTDFDDWGTIDLTFFEKKFFGPKPKTL